MNYQKATIDQIQARLDEWQAKLEVLEAKADKAKADARATYLDQVRELKRKQREAGEKLDELREAGSDAAGEIKAGVSKAMDELGSAIENAVGQF